MPINSDITSAHAPALLRDLGQRLAAAAATTATKDAGAAQELQCIAQSALKVADHLLKSLHSAQQQHNDLTAALPQMLWSTLPDGSHIYFNSKWVEYTGRSLEDSYGFGWLDAFHPDDRQRTLARWQTATLSGEAYEIEYRLRRSDGTYGWVLGRALPLRDETGNIARWFGSCTDIDSQKHAEEVAALHMQELAAANQKLITAERYKSDFFATVSHELRTPLTLILSPLEALLAGALGPVDESLQPILTTVQSNAVRLLQMVNGLLDFAKLDAEKYLIHPEPTDIVALTKALAGDFQPNMQVSGLRFAFTTTEPKIILDVDRYLYERIVFNLLANAIKFTPRGGQISITLAYASTHFSLAVEDTGIGIHKADLPLLFQKFRQIESTSTRRFEGTGLGLALVREFAHLLGGDVSVVSQQGKGSIFTVDLPLRRVNAQMDLAPIAARPGPGVPEKSDEATRVNLKAVLAQSRDTNQGPRILVVEDNVELAGYIYSLLRHDYQVYWAQDGDEALAAIQAEAPDLVLSDVMMPKRDGLSLCRAIKSNPTTASLPVVLLTALIHREALLKGWEAGADDYLFKPFHPRELLARLRSLVAASLERKRGEAALRLANSELESRVAERTAMLATANEVLRQSEADERASRLEAERLTRIKDEFLITLSHELRTPLVPIMGWIELINGGHLDEASRQEAFRTIERNARCELQLIEDLLDTSRVITGKLVLEREQVDLRKVVSSAVDTVRLAAAGKNISLQLTAPVEPCFVLGEARRLQQVLWNIIGNAIKFTPNGGKIDVCLARQNTAVVVSVTDNGVGIEPEFLPWVFDRFRQADSSTTRTYGGLGLGMSLVQHLVEAHGGSVTAQSAGKNHGSVFTVTLPIVTAEEAKQSATAWSGGEVRVVTSSTAPTKPPAILDGVKILFVDDSPDERAFMKTCLTTQGGEVHVASSARDALARVASWAPDIVISDIGMPQEDGCSLIRRIRDLPAPIGRIPAIALTAFGHPAERERALNAGFQLHLTKPCRSERLTEAIRSLLHAP